MVLCHKQEKYLFNAVSSIIENRDVELILIEPGRHSPSRQIVLDLRNFLGEHKAKYVLLDDSSPAEGLNHGLEVATAPIIGFLNGDDYYLPQALEYVVERFREEKEMDVFLCGGLIFDQSKMVLRNSFPSPVNERRFALSSMGALEFFQPGMFWRRDKYGDLRFNEENRACWDSEFLLRLIQRNAVFKTSNKQVALFRIHRESITGTNRWFEWHQEWLISTGEGILGRRFNRRDTVHAQGLRMGQKILKLRLLMRQGLSGSKNVVK